MNIKSFVPMSEFEKIRAAVKGKEKFEYQKAVKDQGNTFTLRLFSSVVDDGLAKSVWRGNNYLVHYDLWHTGKRCGIGGFGMATDDYRVFSDWESFKEWFDGHMKKEVGYEVEEYGQLCFF